MLVITSLPAVMFGAGFAYGDRSIIGVAAATALVSWAVLVFLWVDESASHLQTSRHLYTALLQSQRQVTSMLDRPLRDIVTEDRLGSTDVYDLYAFLVLVIFALRANAVDKYTGLCPHCGARIMGDPQVPDFHEPYCPQFNELKSIAGGLEGLVQKVSLARSGESCDRLGPDHRDN